MTFHHYSPWNCGGVNNGMELFNLTLKVRKVIPVVGMCSEIQMQAGIPFLDRTHCMNDDKKRLGIIIISSKRNID